MGRACGTVSSRLVPAVLETIDKYPATGRQEVFFMVITEEYCFYPDTNEYYNPADLGLEYTDLRIEGRLYAWLIQPRNTVTRPPTVVFLHGNAENLSSHIMGAIFFLDMGCRLLTFDYRGYGKSPGKPTLQGVQEDALSVFQAVRDDEATFGTDIVGFGQSMGGFTLARVLPQLPWLKGAIMDSSLYSFRELFEQSSPQYECTVPDVSALETLPGSSVPKLFIHGTADQIVPYAHTERMYAVAAQPKELLILPDVAHIEALLSPHAQNYTEQIKAFLQKYTGLPAV